MGSSTAALESLNCLINLEDEFSTPQYTVAKYALVPRRTTPWVSLRIPMEVIWSKVIETRF